MLNQRLKGIICFAIVSLIIFSVFGNAKAVDLINCNESVKRVESSGWVDFDGNIIDVRINKTDKIITISGSTDDFREKENIRKYFTMKAPRTYSLKCDIAVLNSGF